MWAIGICRCFRQFAQLGRRIGEQDAAADVEERRLGGQELFDDLFGGFLVERGLGELARVLQDALEQRDVNLFREDVHRHVDQHRAGTAGLGQDEGLFQNLREEVRRIDAPDALAEGPVDLALRGVGVQVHFLVRAFAVIVRRHVAGNDHHRDRVERGVGYPGGGVGQAGREVREQDGGLLGGAGVAVGGVRRNLLVPGVDELDLGALRQGGEDRNIGVPAQPKNVLDTPRFKILDQLV